MADQSLKQLRDGGHAAVAADLAPGTLFYIENDPDGTPESMALPLSELDSKLRGALPQGFGWNYVITPSVATNNLTLAIKTLAGSDPSASDKCVFRIGDTIYTLAAVTSFTKNAGTNWCNAGGAEMAAQPIDFFVYAIGETGASAGLKFGFSRIPWARTMADFVNTSSDEKYIAGNWTNFNSTDKVEVIGRFRAQLSASASFNWSIATSAVENKPIFDTGLLNWNPQFGTNEFSANPTYVVRYKVMRELMFIGFSGINDGNAGTATTFTITMPFLAKNVTGWFQYAPVSWVKNNNNLEALGTVFTTPNSRVLTLRRSAMAVWTASVNNKNAAFTIVLEIN